MKPADTVPSSLLSWRAAATVGLAVAIAAFAHFAPRDVPYLMVEELATSGSTYEGATVRAHGFVVPGSIVTRGELTTFVISREGEDVRVFAHGPRPDTFKDQSELVVRGRVRLADDASLVLDADDLLMKCGANYNSRYPLTDAGPTFE